MDGVVDGKRFTWQYFMLEPGRSGAGRVTETVAKADRGGMIARCSQIICLHCIPEAFLQPIVVLRVESSESCPSKGMLMKGNKCRHVKYKHTRLVRNISIRQTRIVVHNIMSIASPLIVSQSRASSTVAGNFEVASRGASVLTAPSHQPTPTLLVLISFRPNIAEIHFSMKSS